MYHTWVFWFYVFVDSLYTRYFSLFISLNDSLPSSQYHSGPGECYSNYNSVPSSGVFIANCTLRPSYQYSSGYLLVVGRYVTVLKNTDIIEWRWGPVWTICEVTVIGVRQAIDTDGN